MNECECGIQRKALLWLRWCWRLLVTTWMCVAHAGLIWENRPFQTSTPFHTWGQKFAFVNLLKFDTTEHSMNKTGLVCVQRSCNHHHTYRFPLLARFGEKCLNPLHSSLLFSEMKASGNVNNLKCICSCLWWTFPSTYPYQVTYNVLL